MQRAIKTCKHNTIVTVNTVAKVIVCSNLAA